MNLAALSDGKTSTYIIPQVDISASHEVLQVHYDEPEMDRVFSSASFLYSLIITYHQLLSCVKIESENTRCIKYIVSDKRHNDINLEILATFYNTNIETAG